MQRWGRDAIAGQVRAFVASVLDQLVLDQHQLRIDPRAERVHPVQRRNVAA
jgi:hypothetical protein